MALTFSIPAGTKVFLTKKGPPNYHYPTWDMQYVVTDRLIFVTKPTAWHGVAKVYPLTIAGVFAVTISKVDATRLHTGYRIIWLDKEYLDVTKQTTTPSR